MTGIALRCAAAIWLAAAGWLSAPAVRAQADATATEISALKARIDALESQLAAFAAPPPSAQSVPASTFNPAIEVSLIGMLAHFSADEDELPGFSLGHESERAPAGLSLGHSELLLSSNVDDKLRGALVFAFDAHPGEATATEIEEAYIQTLPGAGLPAGMRLKAGRALWTFGDMNERHVHTDDFVDRPLPYRVFLDNAYNDDGVALSYVLPTGLYTEFGAGLFRGEDAPLGGSVSGREAWSAYARFGGDWGRDAAWRLGAYVLDADVVGRSGADDHGHDEDEEEGHHEEEGEEEDHEEEEEGHHEDDVATYFSAGAFSGHVRLQAVDLRAVWAPTGNARQRELVVQAEYFRRMEDGVYALEDETLRSDDSAVGWYVQAIYRFAPNWRWGARFARLRPPATAEVGHDPSAIALVAEWSNSEFSRLRLQYGRESLADGVRDNQMLLQYVTTLGAHGAHGF